MLWEGEELKTYPQIIDKALALRGNRRKQFVSAYAKTSPYALQNIGYIAGYYDEKTAQKIMDIFQTAHPIFGRIWPSAKDAFEMGKKLAGRK